jgi:hypothetical protein
MRTPRRKVLLSAAGGETGRILTLPPIKEGRLKSTERGCGKAQPQHVAGTQCDGNKVSAAVGPSFAKASEGKLRHSRAPPATHPQGWGQ